MRETGNNNHNDAVNAKLADSILNVYTNKKGDLQVHCKEFKIKSFFLDGRGEQELNENVIRSFLNNGDEVKILSLISPIPNIYLLCVLATITKLFLELKNVRKDAFEQLELEMLIMQVVHNSKRVEPLVKPFIDHNKQIVDFERMLKMGINMNLNFVKSLVNLIISRMDILNSKMTSQILKKTEYSNIDDFIREFPNLKSAWEGEIGRLRKDFHHRSQAVLFDTRMIYDVIRTMMYYLRSNKKGKVILIYAEPVKKATQKFLNYLKTNNRGEMSKLRLKDLMVLYYTDPVHEEDPPQIIENIPSYISILSQYYNREVILYGLDEYHYKILLEELKCSKMFKPPLPFLEKRDVFAYERDKKHILAELERAVEETNKDERNRRLEGMKKYISEQGEIQKNINEGFLSLQYATFDQLKLMM